MDGDVPEPGSPAHDGSHHECRTMRYHHAGLDHHGHEIAAAIKCAAPANQDEKRA